MLQSRPVFQNGNEAAAVDIRLRHKAKRLANAQTSQETIQMRRAFVHRRHRSLVDFNNLVSPMKIKREGFAGER